MSLWYEHADLIKNVETEVRNIKNIVCMLDERKSLNFQNKLFIKYLFRFYMCSV